MTAILLLSEGPLAAEIFKLVAARASFARRGVDAMSLPEGDSQARRTALGRAIERLAGPEGDCLVLADTDGAAAANLAISLIAAQPGLTVVTGLHPAMLEAVLSRREHEPQADSATLAAEARDGGRRAINLIGA